MIGQHNFGADHRPVADHQHLIHRPAAFAQHRQQTGHVGLHRGHVGHLAVEQLVQERELLAAGDVERQLALLLAAMRAAKTQLDVGAVGVLAFEVEGGGVLEHQVQVNLIVHQRPADDFGPDVSQVGLDGIQRPPRRSSLSLLAGTPTNSSRVTRAALGHARQRVGCGQPVQAQADDHRTDVDFGFGRTILVNDGLDF